MNAKEINDQQNHHGSRQLHVELEAAERSFTEVSTTFTRACDFLNLHKGALNEHQFGQKLEAASSDTARATEVIAAQNKLRTSYMSGRLSIFITFSKLVRERDKFVRTVMKITSTLPAIKDAHERDLLAGKTLEAVWRYEETYGKALARREKELESDLTEGLAIKALEAAYTQLTTRGVNAHVPPYQHLLMFPTPLAGADLHEFRFADRELNDKVVTASSALWEMLFGAQYRVVTNTYHLQKRNLNEPQYRQRLQGYIEAQNEAAIGVVKNQQQYARIQFVAVRCALTEIYSQLRDKETELAELVEQLKVAIKDDTNAGPNYKLAAMNNVIAADAIIRRSREMQAKWAEELVSTYEAANTSEGSLMERLGQEVAKAPFNSLRWSYHGDGTYTEPL